MGDEDVIDARIAKLTGRQADGLRHICQPQYDPDIGHTSTELWNNGRGVGSSVLEALARRGLVQRIDNGRIYWMVTALGLKVAKRLSEAAHP